MQTEDRVWAVVDHMATHLVYSAVGIHIVITIMAREPVGQQPLMSKVYPAGLPGFRQHRTVMEFDLQVCDQHAD